MEYNFKEIEKKWQDRWEKEKPWKAIDFHPTKPKYYVLFEFFYNSGDLHLGHAKATTPGDILARYKRLCGYNVLFPYGLDEFGAPSENFAIRTGKHPSVAVDAGRKHIKQVAKAFGWSFDFDRESDTSDPNYYKWTQWIFKQFYASNMAYKSNSYVNYCTGCKSTISNEDLEGGVCERCGSVVEQRERSVWSFKMKSYAEQCLEATNAIKMKENLKDMQRHWIGKSEGVELTLDIVDEKNSNVGKLSIFTTCIETVYGITFMSIAPEHKLIDQWKNSIKNFADIEIYRKQTALRSEFDRMADLGERTGCELKGLFAVNPVNGKKVPIFAADYALANYGTGAVMAVPSHDQRDFEFATKFKIPMIQVIEGDCKTAAVEKGVYIAKNSKMLNSAEFNGMSVQTAKTAITEKLVKMGIAKKTINYKLNDWAFNRQRYWGEPFPMAYCDKCGWVALPDNQLPLELPLVEDYKPSENGDSPLARATDWVNCNCPTCGKPAKRETDTMPGWAGSSWYWLRFMDPHNKNEFANLEKQKYWGQVDVYLGASEHVCRHILYAFFWHRFLFDKGYAAEKFPFAEKRANGLLLNTQGKKLSKRDGGFLMPMDAIDKFGADVLRLHVLFLGGYEDGVVWTLDGINGIEKLISKIWNLQNMVKDQKLTDEKKIRLNEFVENATNSIENFEHNTFIAKMFTFVNDIQKEGWISKQELKTFLICVNPLAPHITSEVFEQVFGTNIINDQWPVFDKNLKRANVEIPVQINGKFKQTVSVPLDATQEQVFNATGITEKPKKVIYVKNKIINIII